MILKNITKEIVIKAIERIDGTIILKNRMSTLYDLEYNGKKHPPKFVVSVANGLANGEKLASSEFDGAQKQTDFQKIWDLKLLPSIKAKHKLTLTTIMKKRLLQQLSH